MTTITIDRATVEQALEALDEADAFHRNLPDQRARRLAAMAALRAALAQQAEPVAWRFKPMIGSPWSLSDDGYYISCKRDKGYIVEPLYAAPPQRKLVPLTGEEIMHIGMTHQSLRQVARAVERAHGIKE